MKLVTVMEIAGAMRMPNSTLRHWLKRHNVEPAKLEGRKQYWHRADLERVIKLHWPAYSPMQTALTLQDNDDDEIKHDRVHRELGRARAAHVHRVGAGSVQSTAEQLRRKAESARLRAEEYAKQMAHFKALMHAEQALEHKLNRASSALLALQEAE